MALKPWYIITHTTSGSGTVEAQTSTDIDFSVFSNSAPEWFTDWHWSVLPKISSFLVVRKELLFYLCTFRASSNGKVVLLCGSSHIRFVWGRGIYMYRYGYVCMYTHTQFACSKKQIWSTLKYFITLFSHTSWEHFKTYYVFHICFCKRTLYAM